MRLKIGWRQRQTENKKERIMADIDPRVQFAAERTLLAWIRTGLALMGFGFVLARFSLLIRELMGVKVPAIPETPGLSLWFGTALIALGALVNLLAGFQHTRNMKRLRRGQALADEAWPAGRVISVALAFLGFLMVAYMIKLGAGL
jgi:putative membrane protein